MDDRDLRDSLIAEIEDGAHENVVSMQMLIEGAESRYLDPPDCDDDGDRIFVQHEARFLPKGSSAVIVEFVRGASPPMLARVLRKMAAIFDGAEGIKVANIGDYESDFTDAIRLPNGEWFIYNLREEYQKYLLDRDREQDGQLNQV